MGLQRDRWIGPGLVILQEGRMVWVGMGRRTWKCNVDQVRAATHPEALGHRPSTLREKDAQGKMWHNLLVRTEEVRRRPPAE